MLRGQKVLAEWCWSGRCQCSPCVRCSSGNSSPTWLQVVVGLWLCLSYLLASPARGDANPRLQNVSLSAKNPRPEKSHLIFFHIFKTAWMLGVGGRYGSCQVTGCKDSSLALGIRPPGPHLRKSQWLHQPEQVRIINLSWPQFLLLYSAFGWIRRSQSPFPYLVYYLPMELLLQILYSPQISEIFQHIQEISTEYLFLQHARTLVQVNVGHKPTQSWNPDFLLLSETCLPTPFCLTFMNIFNRQYSLCPCSAIFTQLST